MVTGKCYQSNKRSYHQIRYQSNKLCKENNLSVIDEFYESYKRKYKTNGTSWYGNEQSKKGTSWKSRLQFDIDRMIQQSKDWEEFLKKMVELGYEIKHGKHKLPQHYSCKFILHCFSCIFIKMDNNLIGSLSNLSLCANAFFYLYFSVLP